MAALSVLAALCALDGEEKNALLVRGARLPSL